MLVILYLQGFPKIVKCEDSGCVSQGSRGTRVTKFEICETAKPSKCNIEEPEGYTYRNY